MTSVIEVHDCSCWYGPVLGLSDVSWAHRGGIVGLLGPNGAGKSTMMKMIVGLLRPTRGSVTVFGASPLTSPGARARIGYCPDHDGLYDDMTALEFVTAMARLSGVERNAAKPQAERALVEIGLSDALHRRVRGFSKGMRQRTKLAQALVHDPDLLILDEPLTGVDPVARADIKRHIRALGDAGKSVLVSSHVLHEVESITEEIVVIYQGQLLAEGNTLAIRGLIDKHPHRIRVECGDPRLLAQALAGEPHVKRLAIERDELLVETGDPDDCYDRIRDTAVESGVSVRSISSPDNNLAAVFQYLTQRGRP